MKQPDIVLTVERISFDDLVILRDALKTKYNVIKVNQTPDGYSIWLTKKEGEDGIDSKG